MIRRTLFILILLSMTSVLSAFAQDGLRPRGDVNCDWEVDVDDVVTLISRVLNGIEYNAMYTYDLDLNGDKVIDVDDVVMLISGVLNGNLPPMPAYSGTLPVMFINTEEHKNIVSKEDYLHADWWLDNMGIDSVESIGSANNPQTMLIKGRGNYTWNNYEKKSFRLKLDKKQPLLGMHSDRHFCLMGHPDDYRARLKNTMGFELSRRIGLAYTPAQEPVEVVLNGQYLGLYFLTEKIRTGKHRVNIEEQADGETDAQIITGGWLLEIDNNPTPGEYVYITEKAGSTSWDDKLTVTYHSPEILSHEQKSYLKRYLQKTNDAIYSNDKLSTEWEKYIDIDTLAMFYIVGEIMDDLEYFAGSCYMYKQRGDSTKLIFGPVWDFGNAFQRRAIYGDSEFNKYIFEQPTKFNSHWIEEIMRFPHFRKVVRDHWQAFYGSGFNGLDIDQFTEDFVEQITPAFYADGNRWTQSDITYQKNNFKTFIHRKINWLNSQWGIEE